MFQTNPVRVGLFSYVKNFFCSRMLATRLNTFYTKNVKFGKLTNVGAPSNNTDAATKKYVDDNSSGSPSTTRLTVDSNIDMKDRYRILNR